MLNTSRRHQVSTSKPRLKRWLGVLSLQWLARENKLSDNITPLRAFLVIFYALWVVGGLLQTDFAKSGLPVGPHSYDSSLAEFSELDSGSKAEIGLCTVTRTWVIPSFDVAAVPVIDDRMPLNFNQSQTVSLLRGPPVV